MKASLSAKSLCCRNQIKCSNLTILWGGVSIRVINEILEPVSGISVKEVLQRSAALISKTIGQDLLVVYLLENEKLLLHHIEDQVAESCFPLSSELNTGECLCGIVAETGLSIVSNDIGLDPRCTHHECKRAGIASFIAIPVKMENTVLGVLGLGQRKYRDFESQRTLLETIGLLIALAVRNAQLHHELKRHAGDLEAALADAKRTHERLQVEQTRFRLLFGHMKDGLAILKSKNDESFTRIDANNSFLQQESFTDKELFVDLVSLFPEIGGSMLNDVLSRVHRTKDPASVPDVKIDAQLETWRDFYVYALPGDEIVLISSDITEKKKWEETFRRNEELLKAIFTSVKDAILVKNTDFRYVAVNPAACELFGKTLDQMMGKTSREIWSSEVAAHIDELDQRAVNDQLVEEEYAFSTNNNELFLHCTKVPLRNSVGEIVGVCTVCRDVTDRKKMERKFSPREAAFDSPLMKPVMEHALAASTGDSAVLLLGESGVGKDYWAKWIHDQSKRSCCPFFAVNCAAIAHEIAESELFGHEAGAYTGAKNRKRGLLEMAEGGTLLLNEIGELPLALQSKLLTFLDTKSFIRVGGRKSVQVNARIMAATNKDLESEVIAGRFLDALFYRISVFVIRIPPLRKRLEDFAAISHRLLESLSYDLMLRNVPELTSQSLEALCSHSWPGNIRELRNILERSIIVWEGTGPLEIEHWRPCTPCDSSITITFENQTMEQMENKLRKAVLQTYLDKFQENVNAASKALGISRDSFYRHMKRLGISSKRFGR